MARIATLYQPLSASYVVVARDGTDREIGGFRFTTTAVEFTLATDVKDRKKAEAILINAARDKREELVAFLDSPPAAWIG